MKKFFGVLILSVLIVTGCDLQPRIASIPDSVGEFISERYPTLLAEPDSDIYKTAVADYGVYASPTVYGDGDVMAQDYVLYSPVDDYMMPAQETDVDDADAGMPDDDSGYAPDTDVDDLQVPDYVNEKPMVQEKKPEPKVEPEKPKVERAPEPKSDDTELLRAPLREITVEKGDTLYSLSRRYSVPVNDLAVMNKIGAPFALSVGQKIKVPDMLSVPKRVDVDSVVRVADKSDKKLEKTVAPKAEVKTKTVKTESGKAEAPKKETFVKSETKADTKTATKVGTKPAPKAIGAVAKADVADSKKADVKKTEAKKNQDTKKTDVKKTKKDDVKKAEAKKTENKKADAKKTDTKKIDKTTKSEKQPKQRTAQKMVARSSSKFSWPVRGKILSGYGSKSNGLFNDGINIKATRGAAVVAAENGFVAYAGNEVKGMGNLVIIQHSDGWMTVYAHMESMSVRRGHGVSVGQKIGTVGTSGKVDQPQLHFEIRKGTKAYNPVNYLKK